MKESEKALYRHDVSDTLWEKIKALLLIVSARQGADCT
jgi:hypothetical protein